MSIRIWTIIVVVSSIFTLFALATHEVSTQYSKVWVLPIAYLFFFLLIKPLRIYLNGNIGMWAINIIMFIRYVIIPYTLTLQNSNIYSFGPEPTTNSYDIAILLMLYELCVIMLVIFFISHRIYIMTNITKNKVEVTKPVLPLLVFSILSFLYLKQFPGVIAPNNLFIITKDIIGPVIDVQFDGAIVLLAYTAKLSFFLIILQVIIERYQKRNGTSGNLYSLLALLAILGYIGLNTGNQRWGFIIPAIVFMFLIHETFPKQFKIISVIVIPIVIIMFLSISIKKFMWDTTSSHSISFYINMFTGQLQMYFSGPQLVAQGIETIQQFSSRITASTLINDFGGSLPYFSRSFDQLDRINRYFNMYLFGNADNTSQIMPMISIGYAYFSVFGAPFFSILCIFLSMVFDIKAKIANDLKYKYVYTYTSLWCALSMGFNTQIVFGWFIQLGILLLIFKINDVSYFKMKSYNLIKYNKA
jgi:hypothetical protein